MFASQENGQQSSHGLSFVVEQVPSKPNEGLLLVTGFCEGEGGERLMMGGGPLSLA